MLIHTNSSLAASSNNLSLANLKPEKTARISPGAEQANPNSADRLADITTSPLDLVGYGDFDILDPLLAEETRDAASQFILSASDTAVAVQANLRPETVLELLEA